MEYVASLGFGIDFDVFGHVGKVFPFLEILDLQDIPDPFAAG